MARELEGNWTRFTPHYIVWVCPASYRCGAPSALAPCMGSLPAPGPIHCCTSCIPPSTDFASSPSTMVASSDRVCESSTASGYGLPTVMIDDDDHKY